MVEESGELARGRGTRGLGGGRCRGLPWGNPHFLGWNCGERGKERVKPRQERGRGGGGEGMVVGENLVDVLVALGGGGEPQRLLGVSVALGGRGNNAARGASPRTRGWPPKGGGPAVNKAKEVVWSRRSQGLSWQNLLILSRGIKRGQICLTMTCVMISSGIFAGIVAGLVVVG